MVRIRKKRDIFFVSCTKVEIDLINSLIPFYHEGFKYDENTKVKKGGQSFCTSRLVLTSCEKEATV